jgi:hypothetical protein
MKKIIFLTQLLTLLFFFSGFATGRYISPTIKKIVYARDGGICQCCGSGIHLEYDHIIPYSCGGSSTVSNIQLLCQRCNRSKSNGCYCKIHNKRVGNNCCEHEATHHATSSTSVQCSGITSKGLRCRIKTTNKNGRCQHHQ